MPPTMPAKPPRPRGSPDDPESEMAEKREKLHEHQRRIEEFHSALWSDNFVNYIIVMVGMSLHSYPQFYSSGMIIATGGLTGIVNFFIWIHKKIGLCGDRGVIYREKQGPSSSQALSLLVTDDSNASLLIIRFLYMFRALLNKLLTMMLVLNAIGVHVSWSNLFWWRLFFQLTHLVHFVNRYDEQVFL